MSLTNIKEKTLLKKWAVSNGNDKITRNVLSNIDNSCESYWIELGDNETYILEYGFDTISDLQNEIKHALPDEIFQDMYMPLAVASFKLRRSENRRSSADDSNEANPYFIIPDFVYNF